jgi:hypothetical protein
MRFQCQPLTGVPEPNTGADTGIENEASGSVLGVTSLLRDESVWKQNILYSTKSSWRDMAKGWMILDVYYYSTAARSDLGQPWKIEIEGSVRLASK